MAFRCFLNPNLPAWSEVFSFSSSHPQAHALHASIIAIHGLDGHPTRSWTASNGAFWLKDFLPEDMPYARILTYGYNAYTRGGHQLAEQGISQHAQDLVDAVASERELDQVLSFS
jgi:hypothetical protein